MGETLFGEFTALLLVAALVGALATVLRQPLIVAFIAVGLIVGPSALGLITDAEVWELLSTVGISLLLFVVGLRLDLDEIRETGPVALLTGLGQVLFTSAVGYAIAIGIGLSPVAALYVAVALTFSSTIIIVKLLSDKREIDALHGRIAVGFLIVQDLVVVIAMIGISAIGAGAGEAGANDASPLRDGLLVVGKGALFVATLALLMRFATAPIFGVLARSPELLVLGAIAWATLFAAGAETLGFSREVGAFLAGVALASTPYRDAIGARLVSMRDFLLLFFFVTLGASLDLSLLGTQILPAIAFSAFVLIGNPVIVMLIMGLMGYRKRTGFLAGLTVAQISEFSLILAALGLSLGHIEEDTMALITLVGLVTIGLSTYLILYSHQIYDRLAPWLEVFERKVPAREMRHDDDDTARAEVIVFGLGRYGGELMQRLTDAGVRVMGVDFDPGAVRNAVRRGLHARFGDAEDPELPQTLGLRSAEWVVSALTGVPINLAVLRAMRAHGFRGRIALTAHSEREARSLEQAGADLVLRPFVDAAAQAAVLIGGERVARALRQSEAGAG
ncbi:MAG: cation:proton antiporter family protein [Acidimicrobiia bacterium]